MDASRKVRRPAGHGAAAILASAAVLAVAGTFYGYAASVGHGRQGAHYTLTATFLSANGLANGADVVLAGVTVGQVGAIALDRTAMMARVTFGLDTAIRLPVDTRLSIGSAGLTSANALMIQPGKSTEMLKPDAVVTDTCEATSLEQQVSQYIFGSGGAPTGCGG